MREPGPIFVFCARLVQLFLYYYRLVAQRLVSDGFVWLRDGCDRALGRGARVYTPAALRVLGPSLSLLVPLKTLAATFGFPCVSVADRFGRYRTSGIYRASA